MKRLMFVFVLLFALCNRAFCQVYDTPSVITSKSEKRGNYELPLRFSPDKLGQMVYSTKVEPCYIANGREFWYSYKTSQGTSWYYVDMVRGVKLPLFSTGDMAAQLGTIFKSAIDPLDMNIDKITFSRLGDLFTFRSRPFRIATDKALDYYDEKNRGKDPFYFGAMRRKIENAVDFYFIFDRKSSKIRWLVDHRPEHLTPQWASPSPDGNLVVFCRNNNIKCMTHDNFVMWSENPNDRDVEEFAFTTDGTDYDSWSSRICSKCGKAEVVEAWKPSHVKVWWSPDSKYFAVAKGLKSNQKERCEGCSKERIVKSQGVDNYNILDDSLSNFYHSELYIFDVKIRSGRKVEIERFENQQFGLFQTLNSVNYDKTTQIPSSVWVGDGSKNFYLYRTSADRKALDICRVDITKSSIKVTSIIEDKLNRELEMRPLFLTPSKQELLFWSQRTGLGHLYRYNLNTKVIEEVTSGSWECEQLFGFGTGKNSFYYSASGSRKSENPYHSHLYNVDIQTKDTVQLTTPGYNHSIIFDSENGLFIDNYSSVDTPPSAKLCALSGRTITSLETADLSKMKESGYSFPERFTVKASNGVSDLYGVMYKPMNFDSTSIYPIVHYLYPTAASEQRASHFSDEHQAMFRLAQFGFVVVAIGSRAGEPNYMNLYGGNSPYSNGYKLSIGDKAGAMNQLANRYSYLDRNNIAIVGYDKSAIMAAVSQLVYPSIYKTAVVVTSQGDKELSAKAGEDKSYIEIIGEGDKYASKLKGSLLIVARPDSLNLYNSTMINLSHSLVKSGKRFDMIPIFSNSNDKNSRDNNEYIFWRIGDFLCEKLFLKSTLGADIPISGGY